MPRIARHAPGGIIYHVLNRGVGKATLFRSRKDFEAFQRCLVQTQQLLPMRILAYCVMSNHWHLVLWPQEDGELAKFVMRLTISHVRRWLIHRRQVGTGHVYQGRYKSFAMQDDGHLSTVCRYVERNPLRADIVKGSSDWCWSSAGQSALPKELQVELEVFPARKRRDWVQWVDRAQTRTEELALQKCIEQNRPFGDESWIRENQKALGWREPMKIGRPRKVNG